MLRKVNKENFVRTKAEHNYQKIRVKRTHLSFRLLELSSEQVTQLFKQRQYLIVVSFCQCKPLTYNKQQCMPHTKDAMKVVFR